MYAAPPVIETEVFASLPREIHNPAQVSAWVAKRRASGVPPRSNALASTSAFLEGLSFDRDGVLYCVDIPHGRIFRMSTQKKWEVFAEYDGEPSGLKIHRDGRIFVADHKRGLLIFDPKTAAMEVALDRVQHEGLKGLSDLVFASNGDLYFTDQGESSLQNPSGRVYRLRSGGQIDLLFDGLEGPNGLVLNKDETTLHVAVIRANRVINIPLLPDYKGIGKAGIFLQLSGSPNGGPDGVALDEQGNIAVVIAQFGTVWVFSRMGEPIFRIKSCAGLRVASAAYGGADGKSLFITEAEQGVILKADLPVRGKIMYSHM